MNCSIRPYKPSYRNDILTVWEQSVLATHHFLSTSDFEAIKEFVSNIDFTAFQVFCLVDDKDKAIGFIGIDENKIEMLFLHPDYFGKGLGKMLLSYGTQTLKANLVDVNEQNTDAVRFYKKAGFEIYKRTDIDDQGRKYPLLRMKLL